MSEESEMQLVGAMLLWPEVLPEVSLALEPEDFANPRHRSAFRTLRSLASDGIAYDCSIFAQRFGGEGAAEYALEAQEAVVSQVLVPAHIETVACAAKKRALVAACFEVIESADVAGEFLNKAEAEHWLAEMQTKLAIDATIGKSNLLSSKLAIGEALRVAEERAKNRGELPWMRTGFMRLDELLLGLQRSHLVLLAGKPGAGKTALALNMAVNVSKGGNGVLVCSHEMGISEIASRIVSADSRVPGLLLETGNLEAEHFSRLTPAAERMSSLPMWFCSKAPRTPSELMAEAQSLKRKHGLALIVVDYLQLMDPSERRQSREQAVSDVSRGLKRIAMDLGVCVLALSQLNRASDRNAEPALSELRESGALEQDANSVIMIWAEADDAPIVCGKVAKNRSGQIGAFQLGFKRAIQKFETI